MKVERNMSWAYIARVVPTSTASSHKVHRTDIDPVPSSRTDMQLEHKVQVDDTPCATRVKLAPPSVSFGIVVLSEH